MWESPQSRWFPFGFFHSPQNRYPHRLVTSTVLPLQPRSSSSMMPMMLSLMCWSFCLAWAQIPMQESAEHGYLRAQCALKRLARVGVPLHRFNEIREYVWPLQFACLLLMLEEPRPTVARLVHGQLFNLSMSCVPWFVHSPILCGVIWSHGQYLPILTMIPDCTN